MRFFIAGEGPSDLCDKTTGKPGLLLQALRQLAEAMNLGESPEFVGVSQMELSVSSGRAKREPRQMFLRGNKRMDGELSAIGRRAEALARHVNERVEEGEECGAVLFTDCDFTNRSVNQPDTYHAQVIIAIEGGFAVVDGFRNGVAMVPKMRSESWVLCKYQDIPYAPGNKFEALPANDHSPNCAKKVLAQFLELPVDEMYECICDDDIDWTKISCSSYNFFRRRFEFVLCRLAHCPTDCTENCTLITQGAKME